MAQRIIGLDLGANSICVATIESTLRSVHLVALDMEIIRMPRTELPPPVPGQENAEDGDDIATHNHAARTQAISAALSRLKNRGALVADHVVTSIPADHVYTRVLDFPFSDQKRIEEVLPFELEAHIPCDIEDVIIDHYVLKTGETGCTVFAAAVPMDKLQDHLDVLRTVGIDPRLVSLASFGYSKLLQMNRDQADGDKTRCVAVVDLGRRRTDITINLDGRLAFARTIRRGADHMIRTLADGLGVSTEQAERLMLAHGRVLNNEHLAALEAQNQDGEPNDNAKVCNLIRAGLAPLLRDINQTLRSQERINNEPVEKLLLAGGLANLPGLVDTAAELLEVPTERLKRIPIASFKDPLSPEEATTYAESVGLALELARGTRRETIDFRRDAFAYGGNFQYLADRAVAILIIILLGLGGLYNLFNAKRDNLEAIRNARRAELSELTEKITGQPITNPFEAMDIVQNPPQNRYARYLPERSAIWALRKVSEAVQTVRESHVDTKTPTGPDGPSPASTKPGGPSYGLNNYSAPVPRADSPEFARPYDIEIDKIVISMQEEFTMRGGSGSGEVKGARSKAKIDGHTNNVESRAKFKKLLNEENCFTVTSDQEKKQLSQDRHTGWRKFEMEVSIRCEGTAQEDKKKKVPATDKAPTTDLAPKKEPYGPDSERPAPGPSDSNDTRPDPDRSDNPDRSRDMDRPPAQPNPRGGIR